MWRGAAYLCLFILHNFINQILIFLRIYLKSYALYMKGGKRHGEGRLRFPGRCIADTLDMVLFAGKGLEAQSDLTGSWCEDIYEKVPAPASMWHMILCCKRRYYLTSFEGDASAPFTMPSDKLSTSPVPPVPEKVGNIFLLIWNMLWGCVSWRHYSCYNFGCLYNVGIIWSKTECKGALSHPFRLVKQPV